MSAKSKDHSRLICDIGEISGLFVDSASLDIFLQRIVQMISRHMNSEVCSVYLYYEESDELVLKATKGLHADSIGRVRMKLGEGLTGLALKELRPICEKNASRHPHYKWFSHIGEEQYESFLAVPIQRGNTRIGVIVIQNTMKNYFGPADVRVLRAITSQLANTIETAKILMTLHEQPKKDPGVVLQEEIRFIKGRAAAKGFACGEAVIFERGHLLKLINRENFKKKYSLDEFEEALALTEEQLEACQSEIEEKLSDVASLIFTAQILMLKDRGFIQPMVDLIKDGMNPPKAILHVVTRYVEKFRKMPQRVLREKANDVEDIGRRIIENLTGLGRDDGRHHERIVIAREMLPSDILKLSSSRIKGVVLLSGGVTSHLAILARSLDIPLVIVDYPRLLRLPSGARLLIDGELGNIYISPSEEILRSFQDAQKTKGQMTEVRSEEKVVTRTRDGRSVKILANINLLSDLKTAGSLRAEGIGLYRSEFPFIVRPDFPSEEEQFVIYKKLVEGMPGDELVFRTLDIGGDKVLSYFANDREENPFLGMRSIRFSLRHKEIFVQQIRAVLRAGAGAPLRIMFPMISSLDEFVEARDVVEECVKQLKKEGVPHNGRPDVGMMVELPAVMEIIGELAREADFFSIGTNDFIQYMLAVDRTNEKVADFYLPHHPAVLRTLKKVADAARTHGVDVSVCGEMAHQARFLPYLLGIGIRKLSLDPRYIESIRAAVTHIEMREAEKTTEELLRQSWVRGTGRIILKED